MEDEGLLAVDEEFLLVTEDLLDKTEVLRAEVADWLLWTGTGGGDLDLLGRWGDGTITKFPLLLNSRDLK